MQRGAIGARTGAAASEDSGAKDSQSDEAAETSCQGQVPTPPQLQLLLANVKSSEAAAKLPRP